MIHHAHGFSPSADGFQKPHFIAQLLSEVVKTPLSPTSTVGLAGVQIRIGDHLLSEGVLGALSPMIESFVEFALSFCFVWLAFVASYSLYCWYNSPRRIIRRKLIETGL